MKRPTAIPASKAVGGTRSSTRYVALSRAAPEITLTLTLTLTLPVIR
jgi:hypothetical protein